MGHPAPVTRDVQDWFAELPAERRQVLRPVFDTVHAAMPAGYELGMEWGTPGWDVPLERFPHTYNDRPLAYASIAARKAYNALYLMGLYTVPDLDAEFREKWVAGGRKLDLGKSCLRFRTVDDVDLDLVANVVAAVPVEAFVEDYVRSRG